ncbi:MAG: membrane protein insertase YidC, partial [Dehalococcoidia bacterium]
DSGLARVDTPAVARPAPPSPELVEPLEAPSTRLPGRPSSTPDTPGRLVTVESPLYRFTFSTIGARLVGATLKNYQSFAPGDSGPANIVPVESEFLAYRVVLGRDTVDLSTWSFDPSTSHLDVSADGTELAWQAQRGRAVVTLRYRFSPDDYRFDVQGDLSRTASEGALVLVGMGPGLRMVESDSVEDRRLSAVVTRARSTEKVDFDDLDPGERQQLSGQFEWVAIKSKYFLAAILTLDAADPQFGGVALVGGERPGKQAARLHVMASLSAPGGRFQHAVYVGPQEYRRVTAMGHELNAVNPYGWIFRPIIQPFSVMIVWVLLWMHENLSLAYGWVLVLFGILVRGVLWPLNQKAMRSSMAMQAVQP